MSSKKYTHDLIVIGGGSGGLTVAAGAAQLGVRTALIEKEHMGGDCLYFGCVPSKTLIKSAAAWSSARRAAEYGLPEMKIPGLPDAGDVMSRVRSVIASIEPHDSPERFRGLGVDVYLTGGEFTGPHTFLLKGDVSSRSPGSPETSGTSGSPGPSVSPGPPATGGTELSAPKFVISTGSSPFVPPIPGLQEAGYITNRDIFSLKKMPRSLIVIGGGPIGVEMSQAFARLGTAVTLIDMGDHVLIREDRDMAEIVQKALAADGVSLELNASVESVSASGGGKIVQLRRDESEQAGLSQIEGDLILVAAGRRGNTDDLGLEKAGVRVERSYIPTDRNLRTSVKHIYACGDVNGKFLFTHAAGAEGSIIIRRAVLHLPATMSYDYIPWSTYSDPELASVGYNEKRASEAGIDYRTLIADFDENDRARAEKSEGGRLKILLDRKDRVIGVQIAAAHAGELIVPAIFAVRKGWKISEFLSPVFPYPTLAEIYRKAAGNHLSPRLFNPKVRDILKILFHYRGTA